MYPVEPAHGEAQEWHGRRVQVTEDLPEAKLATWRSYMATSSVPSYTAALSAARLVGVNQGLVAKSLERISSGLRIVRAADDPAGLSISERLRAQWRGLNRASLNATDGIGLLQTADSALSGITGLLQGIRELAVSAADGTKTAADRSAIQAEVSEYLAEIDRIAGTTEYNTKRLLNGELGALVSSSDYSRLRGAVSGDVGLGGSFVIEARARDTGALERQLSDVFTVTGTGDMAGPVSGLATQVSEVNLVTDQGGGVGFTGVSEYQVVNSSSGQTLVEGYISTGVNATLSVTALSLASFGAGGVSFAELFEATNITAGDKLVFAVSDISFTNVSVAFSAGRDIGAFITDLDTALGARITATGNNSGQLQLSLAAGVAVTGVTFNDADSSGSRFNISLNGSTGVIQTNALHDGVSVTLTNNGTTWSGNLVKTGANQGLLTVGDANTGQMQIRFDPDADYSASGILSQRDQFTFAESGGGNAFQEYATISMAGSAVTNGTYMLSAVSSVSFAIYGFDNDRYTSLVNAGTDQDLAVQMARGSRFYVDGTPATNTWTVGDYIEGEDLDDSSTTNPLTNLRLAFNGGMLQKGERAVFDVSTSSTIRAGSATTLASIDAFAATGVFSGATSRSLELYLSDRQDKLTVNLTSTDTLEDAAGKLSLALWNPDGSGLLGDIGFLDEFAPPDLAHVNTVGSARGTLSIAVPYPGAGLVVGGDDELIDALGLAANVEAEAPLFSVTATNAVTNEVLGTALTDTGTVTGLIPGITLYLDQTLNLSLDPEPNEAANTNLDFPYWEQDETPAVSITAGDAAESLYLHVSPNPMVLQVGADVGHTLGMLLPEVSTETLGLSGLNVATRDKAGEAIAAVDHALAKVAIDDGRIGAWQNRLESAVARLDVAAENTMAAESRIRDLDYAREVINLARAELLSSSASFALVQANLQAASVVTLLTA